MNKENIPELLKKPSTVGNLSVNQWSIIGSSIQKVIPHLVIDAFFGVSGWQHLVMTTKFSDSNLRARGTGCLR